MSARPMGAVFANAVGTAGGAGAAMVMAYARVPLDVMAMICVVPALRPVIVMRPPDAVMTSAIAGSRSCAAVVPAIAIVTVAATRSVTLSAHAIRAMKTTAAATAKRLIGRRTPRTT